MIGASETCVREWCDRGSGGCRCFVSFITLCFSRVNDCLSSRCPSGTARGVLRVCRGGREGGGGGEGSLCRMTHVAIGCEGWAAMVANPSYHGVDEGSCWARVSWRAGAVGDAWLLAKSVVSIRSL